MADAFTNELALHLRSDYPILFLVTQEEERALDHLQAACRQAGREYLRPRHPGGTGGLAGYLNTPGPTDAVIVVDDIHRKLGDPDNIRMLADVSNTDAFGRRTVVILTPWIDLPLELERLSSVLELPLPSPELLRTVLYEVCADTGVLLVDEDAAALVRVGQGLTVSEARRAFRKAMIGWPEEVAEARMSVERDKRRALHRSRVLQHVDALESMDDVGGMDQLKAWLFSRRDAFSPRAREFGLPTPRGLLLMGIQGCGKSLTAKAVARFWSLPLVRLDLSAVYGQHAPEEALRGALQVAEAMAPVVLWIDEIEKGFDKSQEGPAARLLGGMVTWLQEKRSEVFVVATANRVEALPPELPRKGRFDEIFFVDLPDVHERRAIVSLHLMKRGFDPASFDLDALVKATEKMTGSEIEQLVIAAMYSAFGRNELLAGRDLMRARAETVTLYETFESEIKKLREWARKRARPASADRRKIDYFSEEEKK